MTGAKMAVEQLNAKGGVNGKKLEAVLLDDQCKPEQAVNVAGQIINQKIKYVVGHLCSGATIPVAKTYEEEGILMITPAATNPTITQQGYQMVFRTIGTDKRYSTATFLKSADTLGVGDDHLRLRFGDGSGEFGARTQAGKRADQRAIGGQTSLLEEQRLEILLNS